MPPLARPAAFPRVSPAEPELLRPLSRQHRSWSLLASSWSSLRSLVPQQHSRPLLMAATPIGNDIFSYPASYLFRFVLGYLFGFTTGFEHRFPLILSLRASV